MSVYDGIATIDVCGHEVPLPAYWRIVELWNEGKSEDGIVAKVSKFTGPDTVESIKQVVSHVVDNQKRMQHVPIKGLKRNSALQTIEKFGLDQMGLRRRSALLGRKDDSRRDSGIGSERGGAGGGKRISAYRKNLLEVKKELGDAEERLEAAREVEEGCVRETVRLQGDKERESLDEEEKVSIQERLKVSLEKHKVAEEELRYAKALVRLHRASLR